MNSSESVQAYSNNILLAQIVNVPQNKLDKFSIKQPVLFADIYWENVIAFSKKLKTEFSEIPKFPSVHRDLSIVVDKNILMKKLNWQLKLQRLADLQA